MFKAALEGKTDAAREIREAIEGKTAQRQETKDSEAADAALIEVLKGRACVAAMRDSDSSESTV